MCINTICWPVVQYRWRYRWPFSQHCEYVMRWLIPGTSFVAFIVKSVALAPSLCLQCVILPHQPRLSFHSIEHRSLFSFFFASKLFVFRMFAFQLSLSFFHRINVTSLVIFNIFIFIQQTKLPQAYGTCSSHLLRREETPHSPLNGIHLTAPFPSGAFSACGTHSVNET